MLLSEAIKEKDYIEESIVNLREYIESTLLVEDKTEFKMNKTLIDGRIQELKDACRKYQQFSVTIQRAKADAIIKVNDTELSVLDAEVIKGSMEKKLESFESLLGTAIDNNCANTEELFNKVEAMRADIKILGSEIDYATWHVEVQ